MTVTTRSSTLAIGFSLPIIGGILCVARILVRRKHGVHLGVDDFFAMLAWVFMTGACATIITGVYIGAFFLSDAADTATLTRQEHLEAQISGAFPVFYNFANASIKFSILFFFRRIFMGKRFNLINWILIIATTVFMIYGFIIVFLYCGTHIHDNFEGPWDNCPVWGFKIQFVGYIVDNLIDLCILVLPIPFALKLQTDPAKKFLLVLVFAMGGFAFVAGVLNTAYQFTIMINPAVIVGVPGSPTIGPSSNFQLLVLNWPLIEVGVGLIACNMPMLSAPATRFLRNSIRSVSKLRGHYRSGSAHDGLPLTNSSSGRVTKASESIRPWHEDAESSTSCIKIEVPYPPKVLQSP